MLSYPCYLSSPLPHLLHWRACITTATSKLIAHITTSKSLRSAVARHTATHAHQKASPIVCCISNSLSENFLLGNLVGLGVSTGLESSETCPRCMARSAAPLLEGPGPGGSEAALRSVISACCPNAMAVVSFEHTKLKAVLGPLSSAVALKVNSFLKPNSTVFA